MFTQSFDQFSYQLVHDEKKLQEFNEDYYMKMYLKAYLRVQFSTLMSVLLILNEKATVAAEQKFTLTPSDLL